MILRDEPAWQLKVRMKNEWWKEKCYFLSWQSVNSLIISFLSVIFRHSRIQKWVLNQQKFVSWAPWWVSNRMISVFSCSCASFVVAQRTLHKLINPHLTWKRDFDQLLNRNVSGEKERKSRPPRLLYFSASARITEAWAENFWAALLT